MAGTYGDGKVDLTFSADRTQVVGVVHPPRPGRLCTPEDIVERLRGFGVIYGFRDDEIARVALQVDKTNLPVGPVILAQGQLPRDGTDAQTIWLVSEAQLAAARRTRQGWAPLYLELDENLILSADAPIADIIPSQTGTPGKTVDKDFQIVHQVEGRPSTLTAGDGVYTSADGLHFYASKGGLLQLIGDSVHVHAISWINTVLEQGAHHYPGNVVLRSDMRRGGSIRAHGFLAASGDLGGVTVRANGDVLITRAARCRIVAEGNVFITGSLLHCHVHARGKLIGGPDAVIKGGSCSATAGIEADSLGSSDGTPSTAVVIVDALCEYRHTEIEAELQECRIQLESLSSSLRYIKPTRQAGGATARNEVVLKLYEQRKRLEERLTELRSEKRHLLVGANTCQSAKIVLRKAAYPGVTLKAGSTRIVVSETTGPMEVADAPVANRRGSAAA